MSDRLQELKSIFSSYKTLIEMFLDRGYTSLPTPPQTFNEFIDTYKSQDPVAIRKLLTFIVKNQQGDSKQVIYIFEDSLNNAVVENLKKIINSSSILDYTIVYHNTLTSHAQNSINDFDTIAHGSHFEILNESDIQFNITKHSYSLPHRILTSAEVERDVKKYYDTKDFPIIKRSDPQVKWLAAKKNQIIEIKRWRDDSKTDYDISYRRVE